MLKKQKPARQQGRILKFHISALTYVRASVYNQKRTNKGGKNEENQTSF
jgi:hypothetical protein